MILPQANTRSPSLLSEEKGPTSKSVYPNKMKKTVQTSRKFLAIPLLPIKFIEGHVYLLNVIKQQA